MTDQYQGTRRRVKAGAKSNRRGFTMVELSAAMGIAAILSISIGELVITTYRTFTQEMRQNEMDFRCRQLIYSYTTDVQSAVSVVFLGTTTVSSADQATSLTLGTAGYSPVAPTGQSMTYPAGLPSYSASAIPSADRLIVFQVPSYDSNGNILGSWDYIAYGWIMGTGGTPGEVYRTVICNSLSIRPTYYNIIPEAGNYDTELAYQFHIATTAPDDPDQTYDPFATSGSLMVPANARLQDVDTVIVTATLSASAWGSVTNPNLTLTTALHMRNWRQD